MISTTKSWKPKISHIILSSFTWDNGYVIYAEDLPRKHVGFV